MSEQNSPKKYSWKRILTALGILGSIGVFASSAFARHGWHRGPVSQETMQERASMMAERILKNLDGSDAQGEAINAILDEAIPEMYALKKEGRALKGKVLEALSAETIDRAEVSELKARIQVLSQKGVDQVEDLFVSVAEVLTPEQRAQVKEFAQKRHGHFDEEL